MESGHYFIIFWKSLKSALPLFKHYLETKKLRDSDKKALLYLDNKSKHEKHSPRSVLWEKVLLVISQNSQVLGSIA